MNNAHTSSTATAQNGAACDDVEKEWRGLVEARDRIRTAHSKGESKLDLSNLGLRELPPDICELKNLKELILSGNLLKTLPSGILKLEVLEQLILYDNLFTTLPSEIVQMSSLTELNLSRNRVSSVPSDIRRLRRLRSLALSVNRLTTLPPEIGELEALNEITLYDNVLESLPATMRQLMALDKLYLDGNSSLNLPDEVIGAKYADCRENKSKVNAPQSILNYYFANQQRAETHGTLPLNEAKVIVLGEAKTGKSSLILALTEKLLKQPLLKTDGIVQKRWKAPLRSGRLAAAGEECDESLQMNFWDFGGQEVYKHTHTFFLTRRAVYLLVADARANERQNNLEFWLQMASSFGDSPPVWIAVNKCDEHGDGPDENALMRKYGNLIRGFIRTSCWTNEGVDELREILVKEALGLEGVRRPINKVWFAIKQALETMKADVISTEDYCALCREHGESEADMPTKLLELWDILGTVRYFPERVDDPPEIRDSAILNPEWVTKAVYAVLDDSNVRESGGLAVDEDFQRILKSAGYPSDRTRMIEHVMRRFDLLVDTPDYKPQHKMLVPQLLPEREPQHDWPTSGTLEFIYRYTVLPAGLLPSFIARSYKRLSKSPSPWRHGCILDYPTSARARVIGDTEQKQVTISVAGDPIAARDALDAVRSIFDELHSTVQGLGVDEFIPVRGRVDAPLVSYRYLRALELEGVQIHPFQGSTPTELIKVDVREALSAVRGAERAAIERQSVYVYIAGEKPTVHFTMKNQQNNSGTFINSPVGLHQHFTNYYNAAESVGQAELAERLKRLIVEAENAAPLLGDDDRDKLVNRLESLTETVKKDKVDKDQLQFSAKGIIEAASTIPSIVAATKAVLSFLGIPTP